MLLGRERERETLARLLAHAREGKSGVLALVGEIGIGKTSLLTDTEEVARGQGMTVLRARGIESETEVPFAGLFELLRPVLDGLERIPDPQAAALQSALALQPAEAYDRFAIGAATLSLLAAEAEDAPLAVFVDDAHWLDGSSADALLFAARRLVADRVALVVTVRHGESSLLDGADLPTLPIGGLDEASTASLLRRHRDDPLAARLHRETGGNPLAVIELAAAGPDTFPPGAPVPAAATVAESFSRRLHALPEPSQRMLLLAAAAYGNELSRLARAAEQLGVGVADLEPAEAAGLVTLERGRIEFRHPLVRSAVYGDAPPDLRRVVHRALADALPDAEVDRRAWHLALAAVGPDDAASSALEQAAVRAQGRSAYLVASNAFERAAMLAPVDERCTALLRSAAEAAWLGGLGERAMALLDEARHHAQDPRLVVLLEHLRGHIAARRGPVMEGHAILMKAAATAAEVDPERAALMLAEAMLSAFYAGDAAAMQATAARAEALAQSNADSTTIFFARMAFGMALIFSGAGDRGAAGDARSGRRARGRRLARRAIRGC